MSVIFDTHYTIDQSYEDWDPNLCLRDGDKVFYHDTLVHYKGKVLKQGTEIKGKKLTRTQAISLWQMCYLHTHFSHDPMTCAHSYRHLHGICHTCAGDGKIQKWVKDRETRQRVKQEVGCTTCDGTGMQKTPRYEQ